MESVEPFAEVVLEGVRLYHGSATPGISELRRADEDTVGAGVYLAGESTARAYALHRAGKSGTAVLYGVEIEYARLVDLTNPHTVSEVMAGYRDVLRGARERESTSGGRWYWMESLGQMIAEIDCGEGAQVGRVKLVTQRSGELFSAYLQRQGFDGVVAWEGGEGQIGAHQSYVLFDPAALRISSEQPVIVEDVDLSTCRPVRRVSLIETRSEARSPNTTGRANLLSRRAWRARPRSAQRTLRCWPRWRWVVSGRPARPGCPRPGPSIAPSGQ